MKGNIYYCALFLANLVVHLTLHFLRESDTTFDLFNLTIGIGITKLLVVIFAVAILIKSEEKANQFLWIYWGLILGWFGDLFLYLSDNLEILTGIDLSTDPMPFYFFLMGLISFLAGHVLYIIGFTKDRKDAKLEGRNFKASNIVLSTIGLVTLYAVSVFSILYNNLNELKVPVLAYVVVIMLMVITAVKRSTSYKNYFTIVLGALLFVLSDTILAFSIFTDFSVYAPLLVMSTYGFAQILIAIGYAQGDQTFD